MGLGKTLQALAVACAYREDWPILIVAPSSLRANWRDEATKWVPGLTKENIQVHERGDSQGGSDEGNGASLLRVSCRSHLSLLADVLFGVESTRERVR